MSVESQTKTLTTAGGAGTSSGSAVFSTLTPCKLLAVLLDYSAGQPATTDLTISSGGVVIVTRSNVATDTWLYPRVNASDQAGAAITNSAVPFVLVGDAKVDIAQGNNAETVAVTLVVEV